MQSSKYRLSEPNYTTEFEYKRSDDVKKYKPEVVYYWSNRSEIFCTEGAASGFVLDGSYTRYYATGEICEKGEFESGMKVGEWRGWDKSGKVILFQKFKKGKIAGDSYAFVGDTVVKSEYKNGLKNGKEFWEINGKIFKTIQYRKGLVVKQKERKWFIKKERVENLENSPPPQIADTLTKRETIFDRMFKRNSDEE